MMPMRKPERDWVTCTYLGNCEECLQVLLYDCCIDVVHGEVWVCECQKGGVDDVGGRNPRFH
jgi:hypothetical protein